MSVSNKWMAVMAGTAMTLGCGCANRPMSPQVQQPQSYGEYRQQEQNEERDEFIAEKKSTLDELDNDIGRLEVKLNHEAKYVDAEERAEWSQDLFELRQERDRVRSELERARTASDAEWAEMRGTLGGAVDSLEAGFETVRGEVMAAFDGDDESPSDREGDDDEIAGDARLCPVDVDGVDVEVDKMNGVIVVTLTASDAGAAKSLADRARKVAADGRYALEAQKATRTADAASPAAGQSGAGPVRQPTAGKIDDQTVAVETQVQSVDDGSRIIIKPRDARDLDALFQQIQADKETLGTGRCAKS